MTITTYRDIATGEEFATLPKIHRNMSPITASNFHLAGLEKITVETPDPVPEPSPDPTALAAKERAFAAMLLHYATAFQIDLTTLPDINIGAMLTAAQQAGVSPEAIADASAILMALFNDVVVESGGTSGKAWEGLKERLPGYLGELA